MGLFHRNKITPLSQEDIDKLKKEVDEQKLREEIKLALKKMPRKQRKRALELYERYNKGQYLRPGQDIDNKKLIADLN